MKHLSIAHSCVLSFFIALFTSTAVKTEASSTSKATEFARIAGTYSGSLFVAGFPNTPREITTLTLMGSAHEPKLNWGKQITLLRRTSADTFIFDDRAGKFGRAYGKCIIHDGIMRIEYTAEIQGKAYVTSGTLRKK